MSERAADKQAVAALTPASGFVPPVSAAAGTGTGAPVVRFVPGLVFGGRYRMIALLRTAGPAEVWSADDLTLQTTVALKVLVARDPAGRERLLTEARLARQITHPSVCRVFDIGEADGTPFYSMELVDGEHLALLIRRAGRFATEKVADIGRQLCAGLAAAHAAGVVHGSLAPAKVLLDSRGQIRIIDFGVAAADPEGTRAITPETYLAPEQRGGAPATERSDLFAAGVILYELVTGRAPSGTGADAAAAPRPSRLVPGVDPALDGAIMRALAVQPKRRPATAVTMSALIDAPPSRVTPRVRMWIAGAAVTAVVLVLGALMMSLPRRASPTLTDQDTIVVADVLNTTGEPVFDGTLKVALAVALEQSPFLKVYPDERVRETLQLMERPRDASITRSVAREIARREQLKAIVAGSIARLGSHYVVALEAINAESGDVMARRQVEAATREEVLGSLGTAATGLRETLGESLGSVARFDVPLARATTSSLDALHAYSLALDEGRMVPRVEAIPHLLRAIELDPDFALAQALLSGVYANTGRSADAPVHSRRAFELRDRVSERERFFISWRYYIDAAQGWDQALELAQSWTATYPREPFAFNSLGMAAAAFGGHARAIEAFREAIRLDRRFAPPYGNLAGSLIAANRFDEAAVLLDQARSQRIPSLALRRAAYALAVVRGDERAEKRALDDARANGAAMWVPEWEAQRAAFAGQFAIAEARLRDGAEALVADTQTEVAAQWTVEAAELHAIAGDCSEAAAAVNAALRWSRDGFTLQRAARVAGVCGQAPLVAERLAELSRRHPEATLVDRIQVPVASAALALAQGDAARAVTLLTPVSPYDRAPSAEFWPEYLRGQAYLRLKDGLGAAAQFRSILSHRGEAVASPLYVMAQIGAAQALVVTGDIPAAREAYQAAFAWWKDADPRLAPLTEARREYARLR